MWSNFYGKIVVLDEKCCLRNPDTKIRSPFAANALLHPKSYAFENQILGRTTMKIIKSSIIHLTFLRKKLFSSSSLELKLVRFFSHFHVHYFLPLLFVGHLGK